MDINDSIEKFDIIYQSIINIETFLNDLLDITHKLLMKKTGNNLQNLSTFQVEWLDKNISKVNVSGLMRIWQFIIRALAEIKSVSNYKSFIEILIMKICYGINIPEISDLVKKLQNNSSNVKSSQDNITTKVLNTFSGSKLV